MEGSRSRIFFGGLAFTGALAAVSAALAVIAVAGGLIVFIATLGGVATILPALLAVLPLVTIPPAYLGMLLLRFGARVLPLATSGGRQRAVIALLLTLVGGLMLAVAILVPDLLSGLEAPLGAPLEEIVRGKPHATESSGNAADAIAAIGTVVVFTIFHLLGVFFLSLVVAYVLSWLVSVCVPVIILLVWHWRPAGWRSRPFVLFLRSFRGTSNMAAVGPLIRGTRSRMRVVFLAAPFQQVTSWDPITIGLGGFQIGRPLLSIPLYLLSDERRWRDDVRQLAGNAAAVVIDVSEPTPAVREEVKILEDLGPEKPVLWLVRADASAEASGLVPNFPSNVGEDWTEPRMTNRLNPLMTVTAACIAAATLATVPGDLLVVIMPPLAILLAAAVIGTRSPEVELMPLSPLTMAAEQRHQIVCRYQESRVPGIVRRSLLSGGILVMMAGIVWNSIDRAEPYPWVAVTAVMLALAVGAFVVRSSPSRGYTRASPAHIRNCLLLICSERVLNTRA